MLCDVDEGESGSYNDDKRVIKHGKQPAERFPESKEEFKSGAAKETY